MLDSDSAIEGLKVNKKRVLIVAGIVLLILGVVVWAFLALPWGNHLSV